MEPDDHLPKDDEEHTAVVQLSELRGGQRLRDRHLLVRLQGAELGRVVRLECKTSIGRSQDSTIWIRDDGVSRRHAVIRPCGDHFLLEDLNSANGTFVHGNAVGKHILRDGDLIQLGPTAVFRYSITDADQEDLLRQLYAASVTDSLTGAHNREHFDTHLFSELSYARRHKTELSIVLFDLDHFKRVNDTYGHQAGDTVLVQLVNHIRRELRNEDMFARYGGEEFAAILRGIDKAGAASMAERIRLRVASIGIAHPPHEIHATVSAGCASIFELAEPSVTGLVALADRRLYLAKRQGRNRVVASD